MRTEAEYNRITDPLDAQTLFLRDDGATSLATFQDFERDEKRAKFTTGYEGGQVDGKVAFEYYGLSLDDSEFSQADHLRYTYSSEVGTELPWWQEKRGFLNYEFRQYKFGRSDVLDVNGNRVGRTQVLNNGDVHRIVAGVEGALFTQRLTGRIEAGYIGWDARSDGESGDNNDYNGFAGGFRVAYKPFEERKTQFQIAYDRDLGYSTISNYNKKHDVVLSFIHDIIPNRLDGDASIAFTRTEPSDGPDRNLWELGLGLTYHLYEQLDVSFRYLMRYQDSKDEIKVTSAFDLDANDGVPGPGRIVEYQLSSDGDFWQNILELGITLRF